MLYLYVLLQRSGNAGLGLEALRSCEGLLLQDVLLSLGLLYLQKQLLDLQAVPPMTTSRPTS